MHAHPSDHTLCCNCGKPMTPVALAGHYQRMVHIDVCEACLLFWFDGRESLTVAAPGMIELLRLIDRAQQNFGGHVLRPTLQCPVCEQPLLAVFNRTRNARFKLFRCAQPDHADGFFQTFASYLTEKGYIRPLRPADLQQLDASSRFLCVSCGAELGQSPHGSSCPYCASPISVLDPERLARAIHPQLAVGASAPASRLSQHQCRSCGGIFEPSRRERCPYCATRVTTVDTAAAVAVSEAMHERVQQNYDAQLPEITVAQLDRALGTGDHAARKLHMPGRAERRNLPQPLELKLAVLVGIMMLLALLYVRS